MPPIAIALIAILAAHYFFAIATIFALLREKGFLTGIVTGDKVDLNRRRVEKLRLDFYKPGCNDKLAYVKELCKAENMTLDNVLYIGDDLIDLPLLKAAQKKPLAVLSLRSVLFSICLVLSGMRCKNIYFFLNYIKRIRNFVLRNYEKGLSD